MYVVFIIISALQCLQVTTARTQLISPQACEVVSRRPHQLGKRLIMQLKFFFDLIRFAKVTRGSTCFHEQTPSQNLHQNSKSRKSEELKGLKKWVFFGVKIFPRFVFVKKSDRRTLTSSSVFEDLVRRGENQTPHTLWYPFDGL